MNAIGATLLVFSGGLVLSTICVALLGLQLRTARNLSRILLLEIFDRLRKRKGRQQVSVIFARHFISIWRPFQLFCQKKLCISSTEKFTDLARLGLYANFVTVSLALLLLIFLMLTGDLSNRYVVSHTSDNLPIFFRITGVWAGSSGSLLFWYWLICSFCALSVYQVKKFPSVKLPALFLLLSLAQLIFAGLILFFQDAQPFRTYAVEMMAGRGINPLLLHWAMIIHPPILYLGYVSSLIPFALVMSHVMSGGGINKMPFLLIRRWAIFSWLALGTGILLGSKWAYEELGWGGYWAWDPVENASLMPWLVFTAFLHSLIAQERYSMLRFWNVFLIILSYHMCLVGTWITRSGILEGPHTFAESTIGLPLITCIGISVLYTIRFLYFARYSLRSKRAIIALSSKEGSFLLNNFLMLLSMLIILLGVFSPLLPTDCSFQSGSLQCYNVEWKQAGYNRLLVPIGLIALFLMGSSPLLAWRKSAFNVWEKNIRLPFFIGLLGGGIFAITYGHFYTRLPGPDVGVWGSGWVSEAIAVLTIAVSFFVICGIMQEYWRGVISRRLRLKERFAIALFRLFQKNTRRYGGYLAHLAIVFLFIGYAGSAFKQTHKTEFHYYRMPWNANGDKVHYYSGDRSYVGSYEIQAGSFFLRPVFLSKKSPNSSKPHPLILAQEAHYYVKRGGGARVLDKVVSPDFKYQEANAEKIKTQSLLSRLLKTLVGYSENGFMRTERHFYPQIDPVSGKVHRNQNRHAIHIPTSEPDILSSWNEDLYIQLGALSVPRVKYEGEKFETRNLSLNHFYESYYTIFEKDQKAYIKLFPTSLNASLEIWINPMVKFIWLGSVLFFLSGIFILLSTRKEGNLSQEDKFS